MKQNLLARLLLFIFVGSFSLTAQATEEVILAGTFHYRGYDTEYPCAWYLDRINGDERWQRTFWHQNILPSDYKDKAEITSFSCMNNKSPNHHCAYVGKYQDKNKKEKPLLLSNEKLHPFDVKSISILPDYLDQANLKAVKCSGSGICIAVGQGVMKTNNQLVPFLITRLNGAWSTSESIITNLPKQAESAELIEGTCDANGCLAVGTYKVGDYTLPLIAASNDLGKTWSYPLEVIAKASPKNASNIKMKKVNCSKDSCIAIGTYEGAENKHVPFVAVSRDKGQSWFFPESIISNMPGGAQSGDVRDFDCNSKACTLVGYFDDLKLPLLAISKDNGTTWNYPIKLDNEASRGFDLVNCRENQCIAVGSEKINDTNHLITSAISKDDGETWTISRTENINLVPIFTALTCTEDRCLISGYSNTPSNTPIVFLSRGDSIGKNWIRYDKELNIPYSHQNTKFLSGGIFIFSR